MSKAKKNIIDPPLPFDTDYDYYMNTKRMEKIIGILKKSHNVKIVSSKVFKSGGRKDLIDITGTYKGDKFIISQNKQKNYLFDIQYFGRKKYDKQTNFQGLKSINGLLSSLYEKPKAVSSKKSIGKIHVKSYSVKSHFRSKPKK